MSRLSPFDQNNHGQPLLTAVTPGGTLLLRDLHREIPPGSYYLMVGRQGPSMNRYQLVKSRAIALKEGETFSLDLNLMGTE